MWCRQIEVRPFMAMADTLCLPWDRRIRLSSKGGSIVAMENVMPLTIRGLAVVLFAIAAIGLGQISLAADRCAAAPQPSDFVLPPVGSPFIFRVPDGIVHPVAG